MSQRRINEREILEGNSFWRRKQLLVKLFENPSGDSPEVWNESSEIGITIEMLKEAKRLKNTSEAEN